MDDHPIAGQLAQTIPVAEMDLEKDSFRLAQLAAEMKKQREHAAEMDRKAVDFVFQHFTCTLC